MKRAGFQVSTAPDFERGLELALATSPEIVVSETMLPGGSGFDLCRRLRDDSRTVSCGVVFLAADGSPEAKIRGISAGADDYLSKPLLVKEILSRLHTLFERRQNEAFSRRERPANFTGTLGGMGLVDLFQLIETGKKTCTVHLSSDRIRSGGYAEDRGEKAQIYFREGLAIDAETARLSGERAIYRLLLWEDGAFEIEFGPVTRDATINLPTQALLLEGMRRVDEWGRFSRRVPSLAARLEVDYRALAGRVNELPDEVEELLRLFDGRRSLLEVLDSVVIDDLAALGIVARLCEDEVLAEGATRASTRSTTSLDAWLSGMPQPAAEAEAPEEDPLADLPSVLGQAMIPSLETPSQILSAADPRWPRDTAVTALPEPLPEDTAILSRSTIPAASTQPIAHRPATATGRDAPSEGRLTVRRMGSVVAAPPLHVAPPPVEPAAVRPAAPVPAPAPQLHAAPAASAPQLHAGGADHDTLDEEDDDGLSIGSPNRTRRGPRTATYRTIRRPATARSDRPLETLSDLLDSEPSPPAVEAPDRSRTEVSALPIQAEAAPEVVTAAPAERSADTQPPAREPTPVPEAPELPRIARPAAPVVTALPRNGTHGSHAAEVSPRLAGPRPVPVAPPVSRRPELDADFDRFQQANDEDGQERTSKLALALGVMSVAIVAVFVGWVFTGNDHPEIPAAETNLAATLPGTAVPKAPAWPAIPDEAGGSVGGATTAGSQTATKAAAAPVAAGPSKAEVTATVTAQMSAGMSALKRESYGKARDAFQKVLEVDADNAAAIAGLAQALYGLRSDAAAVKEARRALEKDENQPLAHLVLGFVASDAGREKDAQASYRKYLELDPNGPYAAELRRFLERR